MISWLLAMQESGSWELSWAGWVVMIVSVGGTTFFFGWCLWRVLAKPEQTGRMHGVLDTELQIEEDERKGRADKS
jgi:hypothetical protein